MNYKNSPPILFLIFGAIVILLVACGTFEVGIESTTSSTITVEPQPPQVEITPSATPSPTQEILPTETSPPEPPPPGVPDLVSIGHIAPFASADIGVLLLENEELTVQPGPVDFEIFWGYSPQSGRLAYSSEFFHASESNNLSVSDLWVYDYQIGTAEKWLDDNVTRAAWAPDGEHVTASVYNPVTERVELVLVSGPDQVDLISECASMLFSWSPAGDRLAFINARLWLDFGLDETCLGTYLVDFPGGLSTPQPEVSRVSDFSAQEFGHSHLGDQPLWALEQNALIYPDSPFWVVPLDGSPAFIPPLPGGEDPMNVPRPFGSLWSPQLNQLVGTVDMGPAGFGGVWVYQFSDDLSQIENFYRLSHIPGGDNSDITLVDWWQTGESILVLDGDNPDTTQHLSEFWRAPAVWSLIENRWLDVFSQ
jgi:hypothetical protein